MKVVSVVGARPNFVKLSPVHKSLSKYCEHVIIHTGQHYDYEMSEVFFKELNIPKPDINLEIGSGPPGAQIGDMIKRLEIELGCGPSHKTNGSRSIASRPDMVLVYGDTNSTFAGAFAASVNHIPVAHVEAGLRSFDRRMPEERNRILTDHLSSILFAPTKTGVKNLKKEHVRGKIVNSGDISVEVVEEAWKFSSRSSVLKKLGLGPKSFILFTMHRAESTNSFANLKTIVKVFQDLGKKRNIKRSISSKHRSVRRFVVSEEGNNLPSRAVSSSQTDSIDTDGIRIVFPIHPRTEKYLKMFNLYEELVKTKNVTVTKPLGYIDFLRLVREALRVVTDSGGLQKEAYLLSVPCVTIRKSTEWIETLAGGWNILCNYNRKEILKNILAARSNRSLVNHSKKSSIFGNGNTSEIIRKYVMSRYHG